MSHSWTFQLHSEPARGKSKNFEWTVNEDWRFVLSVWVDRCQTFGLAHNSQKENISDNRSHERRTQPNWFWSTHDPLWRFLEQCSATLWTSASVDIKRLILWLWQHNDSFRWLFYKAPVGKTVGLSVSFPARQIFVLLDGSWSKPQLQSVGIWRDILYFILIYTNISTCFWIFPN